MACDARDERSMAWLARQTLGAMGSDPSPFRSRAKAAECGVVGTVLDPAAKWLQTDSMESGFVTMAWPIRPVRVPRRCGATWFDNM